MAESSPDIRVRHQAERVKEALADTPVVMITGARQVGKSTLALSIGKELGNYEYVSLDDLSRQGAARSDPPGFLRGLALPCIIDEVQHAPDLLLAIKQLVDERRLETPGKEPAGSFLLTGSVSIWDSVDAPESLAGRIERVRLRPFSQGEIEERPETLLDALFGGAPPKSPESPLGKRSLAERVVLGGYPLVQDRDEARAQQWFSEYIARVLNRDIRDLANVRRPEDLLSLLRICATRSGSIANVDNMVADLGAAKSTGRRYYELLLRSYLIEELPAWGTNLARAAVRAPKVLVTDSGLAAHLIGFSSAKFESDIDAKPGAGNLFETFVIGELLKANDWASEPARVFHWRDRSGREVDLLLERRDATVVAVECKLAATVRPGDARHLAFLRDELGDNFRAGAVIYTGESVIPIGDRLWAVPISTLWAGR